MSGDGCLLILILVITPQGRCVSNHTVDFQYVQLYLSIIPQSWKKKENWKQHVQQELGNRQQDFDP